MDRIERAIEGIRDIARTVRTALPKDGDDIGHGMARWGLEVAAAADRAESLLEAALKPVETVRDFGLAPLQIDEAKARALERTVEREVVAKTDAIVELLRRIVGKDGEPLAPSPDAVRMARVVVFDHDARKVRSGSPTQRASEEWASVALACAVLIRHEGQRRTSVGWLHELWRREAEATKQHAQALQREAQGG